MLFRASRVSADGRCSPSADMSHADGRVEIAANNGHNRASPQEILHIPIALNPIHHDNLTFEDFPPGHFGTFGPRHVTREEILAFAAEFDPQPMHLDEAAANALDAEGAVGFGLASRARS